MYSLSLKIYSSHLGFITDLHFKSRGQIPEDSSGVEYDHRDFNPTNGIRMKRDIPSVLALSAYFCPCPIQEKYTGRVPYVLYMEAPKRIDQDVVVTLCHQGTA
jgi:hypothetical protein